jgi:hypothetical protein
MTEIRYSAERLVDAPADVVYHCIADYERHHRPGEFLPPGFTDMEIEQGGVGNGTVVHFTVTAMGQSQRHHARVTEPEPGRVLLESEDHNGLSTRFTVEPQGQQSRVRFDTVYTKSGPQGWIEKLLVARVLGPLYADELERLERYAQAHGPLSACPGAATNNAR